MTCTTTKVKLELDVPRNVLNVSTGVHSRSSIKLDKPTFTPVNVKLQRQDKNFIDLKETTSAALNLPPIKHTLQNVMTSKRKCSRVPLEPEPLMPKIKRQTQKAYRFILPKPDNAEAPLKKLPTSRKRFYKCSECLCAFLSFRHMREHESAHKSETNLNICEYCFTLFASKEDLEDHENRVHINGIFSCFSCKNQYKRKGHLFKHVNEQHGLQTLPFFCGICSETATFKLRASLQAHFHELHAPKVTPLPPSPCKQTAESADLDEMNVEFLEEFLQDADDLISETWETLDLNLPEMFQLENVKPSNNMPYKCPTCDQGCKSPKVLLEHISEHHGVWSWFCDNCEANFQHEKDLLYHKLQTHGKPLIGKKCHSCGKVFKTNRMLNYHALTHSDRERCHNCPYCQKGFYNMLILKQHIRNVHCENKPHICQLCDRAFVTLDYLKKHVLNQHQSERRYDCNVCLKKFIQLSHLTQHMKIHTNQKTVQCVLCMKRFWRRVDLERHVLRNH